MSGIRNQNPRAASEGCATTTPYGAILSRVREARRLSEATRWTLLDLAVRLDEIEDSIVMSNKAALRTALDELDLTGLVANRLDSEAREYQPDIDRDWCP